MQGACGPATEVPTLIRALRDGGPDSREQLERELSDHVQHQGQLYPPAVPTAQLLIDALADEDTHDRLLACELLQTIVENAHHYEGEDFAEPTLGELSAARAAWWSRRRRGAAHEPVAPDPVDREAHEAVRAGVPAYLEVLRSGDRQLRRGMATLLGHFPSAWPVMAAEFAERLAEEEDPEVAAAICLAVGRTGRLGYGRVAAAAGLWRGHGDRYVHRCALAALARVVAETDTAMLVELADCLVTTDGGDWQSPETVLAGTAFDAFGRRRPAEVPARLAGLLTVRLRDQQGPEWSYLAVRLLLDIAFHEGPLPDGAGFAGLDRVQRDAVLALIDTEVLLWTEAIWRDVAECNLPHVHDELFAWVAGQPALF
ncbi:hypothetical protein GCM10010435_66590 [Winogradskya consettensis]|uniref:HEAT repeat domain-containing protein n=2 Tax=Winogradskya consettensis TaxID=113560 RepID=A0A919SN46_9ACTN|nr:hypothetical protein Aco04nite_38170 [Actinoplanes consettensis]